MKDMKFAEKLDFLMNITKISNSALSQKVMMDPSHISRLRRGQRNAVKDKLILEAMAEYFARHCTQEYQLKALSDVLGIGSMVYDVKELSERIYLWLDKDGNGTKPVEHFLVGLEGIGSKQEALFSPVKNLEMEKPSDEEVSFYFGTEGKRKAAVLFLLDVIAYGKPQTLLLFSDEATDWMTQDREFTKKWASLMRQVLAAGNRIKIIHTVSRDLDEMLNAVNQWMPLYMTGSIEPYYYPKKRDGVFKRTLFLSPEVSALISNSAGESTGNEANMLIKNRKVIQSFTDEFYYYLDQCRPLMKVFTSKHDKDYYYTLMEFEKSESNSMIKTESLSILTMPEDIFNSIYMRLNVNRSQFNECRILRCKNFKNNLRNYTFTEIIQRYDSERIKERAVKVSFSDMMGGDITYRYTKEEYIAHLKHLVELLKAYGNFRVKIVGGDESNYMIYVKEDIGAIIAKTSQPPIVLAVNETNLTAAFWDFSRNMVVGQEYDSFNNEEDIKKLEEYIMEIS